MTGFYELKHKLKYWKDKYKKDTQKLEKELKNKTEQLTNKIKRLRKEIEEMKEHNYFYNLWYNERQNYIKLDKENLELKRKLEKFNIFGIKIE